MKQGQRDQHQLRKSFTGLETVRAEEDDYEDQESSAAISELFHGFLAIGTLGSEQIMNDPATPTFAISVENITEKETEVTENELKLINDELEKVLIGEEASPDDQGFNEFSSARNSHVSNGRSSHGSIITLSGKGDGEGGGGGNTVCPLQGYLFGSAIELSETSATAAAKKEHRTSLGELFQRSKIAEDYGGGKSEEKRLEKEVDKSAMNLMKKKLKKKMLHASSRSSTTADSAPAPTETKLHKVIINFHYLFTPILYYFAF